MKISEELREKLKKPLGNIVTIQEIINLGSKRIVSVGDITTLKLLENGLKPHLAIFDFRYMRKPLPKDKTDILKKEFPTRRKIANTAGELSDYLVKNAEKIFEEGGAIEIIGEEDLTALAFFKYLKNKDILVYGQPKKGIVLFSASSFSHEI